MGGNMKLSTVRTMVLAILVATVACAWLAGSAAAAPAVVGSISNATSLSGSTAVAVSGNFAYTVSYWSGQLNVIDISNPASPTLVGSTASTPQMIGATNVTIVGNHAFVTSKNLNASTTSNDDGIHGNSLTVVDISNPAAPAVVPVPTQSASELFGAYAVAVSGNYAYVASQGILGSPQPQVPQTSTGSFSVIDLRTGAIVANIQNASLPATQTNWLQHATGVSIEGNFAYVTAFGSDRLTTIDISNPTALSLVASLQDKTNLVNPNDVATQGNFAYVANQISSGLELTVLNIANPNPPGTPPPTPKVVGAVTDPTLAGAYRVRVNGNFAYVSANSANSVAGIDVSNPSAPKMAGVVTDPQHLANVEGIALGSSGQSLVATSPRLNGELIGTFPPYPLQTGGPTNTGTVSVIAVSVAITPASEPANPTTQQSASFSFTANDAAATMTCSLDHAAFVPCSSPTTANYSSLAGGSHIFTVQATDSIGLTDQASYTWTVNGPPANTSLPTISGTAQQGRKLTVSTGVWSAAPAPTYGYQWDRCNARGKRCQAISKQTNTSYAVTAADVGSRLQVLVTATNSLGSAGATSAATKTVTWSSSAFATATLNKSHTTSPGISLSIPAPGGNLKLSKLTISLPNGLSFASARQALAAGTSVKDLHRKRLSFTASLSHGKLTLTFKKPPTGVKLTVARGLLSISNALERRIRSHKAKTRVSLTLTYTGKPSRTGAIRLRLA
jgi:hypothetical protein